MEKTFLTGNVAVGKFETNEVCAAAPLELSETGKTVALERIGLDAESYPNAYFEAILTHKNDCGVNVYPDGKDTEVRKAIPIQDYDSAEPGTEFSALQHILTTNYAMQNEGRSVDEGMVKAAGKEDKYGVNKDGSWYEKKQKPVEYGDL